MQHTSRNIDLVALLGVLHELARGRGQNPSSAPEPRARRWEIWDCARHWVGEGDTLAGQRLREHVIAIAEYCFAHYGRLRSCRPPTPPCPTAPSLMTGQTDNAEAERALRTTALPPAFKAPVHIITRCLHHRHDGVVHTALHVQPGRVLLIELFVLATPEVVVDRCRRAYRDRHGRSPAWKILPSL